MNKKRIFDYEEFSSLNIDFSESGIEEVKNHILDSYDFIKAYHATKIYLFDNFSLGLLPGTVKFLKERLKKLLIPNFPEYSASIEKIINEFKFSYENFCSIYYVLDRNVFKRAYQYHRYGSENFFAIVDRISKEIPEVNGRQILLKSGIPTTIHFLIKVSDLSEIELNEIADYIISKPEDGGFWHNEIIPSCQITEFEKIPLPWNIYGIPE